MKIKTKNLKNGDSVLVQDENTGKLTTVIIAGLLHQGCGFYNIDTLNEITKERKSYLKHALYNWNLPEETEQANQSAP